MRALRLPGFAFREVLAGNYWRLDQPTDERAIDLDLSGAADDLRALARAAEWRLSGTIDAEGLSTAKPLEGSVFFRLFEEQRITYRFSFSGDDGERYEFSGDKEWSTLSPLESITLLSAGIYGARGDEMARATLRFDLRGDWARWLRSLRLSFDSKRF